MPGTDEKPFKCPTDGCGQTFTNEDHLTVHKLKHQMSLTLSPGGNKFQFPDQTPTPTKFLRYGEEIGLFNEMKNPFDVAFKSAAENLITDKSMHLPPTQEDNDTLNTPTPHIPVIQNDTPIKKRYRTEPMMISAPLRENTLQDFAPLPGPEPEVLDHTPSSVKSERQSVSTTQYCNSGPASQESQTSSQLEIDEPEVEVFDASPVSQPPLKSPQAPTPALTPQHVPSKQPEHAVQYREVLQKKTDTKAIAPKRPHSLAFSNQATTVPTYTETHSNRVVSTAGGATIIPSPAQSLQSASITSTGGSQYMIQMMIQTADGKLVPVNIPALPAASTAATTTNSSSSQAVQPLLEIYQPPPVTQTVQTQALVQQPVVRRQQQQQQPMQVLVQQQPAQQQQQPLATTPSDSSKNVTAPKSNSTSGHPNASMTTKQRLKAAIQQNSPLSQKPFSVVSPGGGRTPSTSDSNPSTPMSSSRSVRGTIEYQDADSSKDLELDPFDRGEPGDDSEKRQRFLERNRAAAHRCRAKKRDWVKNLERKAEDLQATNTRLQNEVTQLRAEMSQLKALLLAHKDCPITIQQRNSGQLTLQRVSTQQQDATTSSSQQINLLVPTQSQSRPAVMTLDPKMKVTNVVSIKPAVTAGTANTQRLSQMAKVPPNYRLHSSSSSSSNNEPSLTIGQLQPQQQTTQLLAVDLSKVGTITQIHSVGRS